MNPCASTATIVPTANDYDTFLKSKVIKSTATGIDISTVTINPILYDFQGDITRWALSRGRAAIFEDCGMGKTFQQLEWGRIIGGTCLIVAPLSVNEQTIREGAKLDIAVRNVRDKTELLPGINITNYEMIRRFIGAKPESIVLDESSILKSIDGKTKKLLIEDFTDIPYRLCCTATPCPNDIAEIANHSAFLGIMPRHEMLASFFVHDEDGWRLRGHAHKAFYRWLASWAMALKSPSDLGYDGSLFTLPALTIKDITVGTSWRKNGELFPGKLRGITDRIKVRRASIEDRVKVAADIAIAAPGQVIVWCGLNPEADAMAAAISGAVNLQGSDSNEAKIAIIRGFLSGSIRVLVTKPKIAGFGMNFQNASTMIFMGLNDSWESYYQCIRRSWRFGQRSEVTAYVVVTDHENEIVENVRRKEKEANRMTNQIISAAREYEMEELGKIRVGEVMGTDRFAGDNWRIEQGDCVDVMRTLEDDSIDLSVFSPPFLALYTYSATERDIGNCRTDDEFFGHFRFVIDELLRVTKPGRNVAVHVAQVPTTLVNNGVIGIKEYRGRVVNEFVERGFIYHGEVVIDKDPQAQAIRTHSKALLFVQLRKDASWLRPALADYIVVFRKPGENAIPIHPDLTNNEWIEWARPIWYGISESDTLNRADARSEEDDRHVCPLQLGTIERVVRLWSNPGETVLSPFAGIGSEGYVSVILGRKFVGIELKPLYAKVASRNLECAQKKCISQKGLFE